MLNNQFQNSNGGISREDFKIMSISSSRILKVYDLGFYVHACIVKNNIFCH
jgi:hypothetical protein